MKHCMVFRQTFLKSENMAKFIYDEPEHIYEQYVDDVKYTSRPEFPKGRLPLEKDVLLCMLYLLRPSQTETVSTLDEAAQIVASNIVDHWSLFNIYTIPESNVMKKVVKLYTEFQLNFQTRENRKHDKWKECMQVFNKRVSETLFNIYTQDPARHKHFIQNFDIKMTEAEYQFLEDQRGARKGRLENFMDKKLSRILEKNIVHSTPNGEKLTNSVDNLSCDANGPPCHNISEPKITASSEDFHQNDSSENTLNDIGQIISHDMPERWASIRLPDGSIRPDFHSSVDEMINVYECSRYQAVSAVITVGNIMFGRKWKHFENETSTVDSNTAPEVKIVQQNGIEKTAEFVALKCILEEVIAIGKATIFFHYNNSKYLSIQGIKIGDSNRSFPKLTLLKSSRETFENMKIAVLNVLAVYSGVTPDELSNKITFSLQDETENKKDDVESQAALEVTRYSIDEKQNIDIKKRFDYEQFDMIIDVRTPDEYKQDHVPHAINLPVLNNEERCKVGTIYSGDPKSARGIGAAIISRSISNIIEENFLDRPRDLKILVYCWRGGLRSKSLAVILKQIGYDETKLLTGGYKVYRQHIQNTLPELIKLHKYTVLAGNTGTGKSIILECMQEKGEQVLHLEELAKHKGSVLGPYYECEQPSQKQFETDLWNFLRKADRNRNIWLEHEGIQIGKLYLPKDLYQMINDSPKVFIQVDLETRVNHLLRDYSHFVEHPETLSKLLDKLIKFVGKKQVLEWKQMSNNRKFPELVSSLITEHYDKAYDQKRKREALEMGAKSSDAEFQWPKNLELMRECILSDNVVSEITHLGEKINNCDTNVLNKS